MFFILCEMYSKIASLQIFERSGIALICITDSIRAVWTRRLSATKIVSGRHLSATCEHEHMAFIKLNHMIQAFINQSFKMRV